MFYMRIESDGIFITEYIILWGKEIGIQRKTRHLETEYYRLYLVVYILKTDIMNCLLIEFQFNLREGRLKVNDRTT